ncbi:Acetyltransferase (GNAT) domain-containing protein [Thiothrix eikelboomii]|uniref:Acetyltransferase (GNAT) domain-containing protein n=1 Tax=Thiothrix eikelboomii TaxID=92487 RepID=A0A1T4VSD8_9GAMM|nr:GNAT family N-acetyltransferase [Thiothrix eikelboomii]SKA67755.1 Acetyltransferase (GNAT) domain-containing protein [Thiothrix eikelboomii]
MGTLSKPRPLEQTDNRNEFDCGRPSLNTWLQTHAWRNQQLGSSRTNVITNEQGKIVAYVSLTAAEIKREYLPKSQQRNRPESIPAVLLGQLAVDSAYQGQGIAQSLLFFAFRTTVQISEQIGCACLITHPLDKKARTFYQHWGFEDTPFDPKGSLIIKVSDLKQNGFAA